MLPSSRTVAVCAPVLLTTTPKSHLPSSAFAVAVGKYSQPIYDLPSDFVEHAPSQRPAAPLQLRPWTGSQCRSSNPLPSSLQTRSLSPSHVPSPGTQVTQPSSGAHAIAHDSSCTNTLSRHTSSALAEQRRSPSTQALFPPSPVGSSSPRTPPEPHATSTAIHTNRVMPGRICVVGPLTQPTFVAAIQECEPPCAMITRESCSRRACVRRLLRADAREHDLH